MTDDPAPDDPLRDDQPPSSSAPPHVASQTPLIYTSAQLLQGRREAWIEHAGEMYRLRLTAQGRLYLTK